jgi:hypothetical protein
VLAQLHARPSIPTTALYGYGSSDLEAHAGTAWPNLPLKTLVRSRPFDVGYGHKAAQVDEVP